MFVQLSLAEPIALMFRAVAEMFGLDHNAAGAMLLTFGYDASWAELLKRVFAVDGFACPGCGGPLALRCIVLNPVLHLRTVVEGSPAALTITSSLLRSTGPPRRPGGGDDRGVYAGA